MFKANNQPGLFSFETELSKKQRDLLDNSKEKWFYKLVRRNINEDNFKPLYSDKASRPNAPVNILVSTLIFKELKGISYHELKESVMFDLRYKKALALLSIDEVPFSRATLFNFQNRLLEHEHQTGINLIEQVFDNLTAKQIKQLSLKTDIQRTDSTLISSNIKKYSRIQLLIEVLIRLERILDETDRRQIGEQLQEYRQNRRNRNIMNIPQERRKIRPNVEALMKEFKARTPGGKAKVRGLFKTSLFAFNAGIAINFGRIFRYIAENGLINGAFASIAIVFHKILWNIHPIFSKTKVVASNFRDFLFYTKYFSKKPIIRPLTFSSF